MQATATHTMEYRKLGPTGLKVSVIGYGAYMLAGHFKDPEQETYETVKRAIELGINFFDTAEAYDFGKSEITLGQAFKKLGVNRSDIVVSTKLFFGEGLFAPAKPNNKGLSRKRIIEGTKDSLKRLQLDYVDVLFAHRYDEETPLEEVCRAFDQVIRDGKVLYWGTSEWSDGDIRSAIEICEKLNLHKPVVEQPQYNMLNRKTLEVDYAKLFDKYGYGTTIWSPLAGGILTGKYLESTAVEGRLSDGKNDWLKDRMGFNKLFGPENIENTRKMFAGLTEIAKELGGSLAHLAVAWALRNKDVSTALCGFSRVSQIEDNVKAVDMYKKLTPEIDARIEKVLNNRPDAGFNPKTFAPFPSRR
jgi:voltage-dependent potassium channel beta subunit